MEHLRPEQFPGFRDVSIPDSLGVARPRTLGNTGGGVEQLELSFQNLALEFLGLETHDSPRKMWGVQSRHNAGVNKPTMADQAKSLYQSSEGLAMVVSLGISEEVGLHGQQ